MIGTQSEMNEGEEVKREGKRNKETSEARMEGKGQETERKEDKEINRRCNKFRTPEDTLNKANIGCENANKFHSIKL